MQKIKLSIPEPCHQSWEGMTPGQQGRFCNACAKTVIDFSEMSDAAVLNYFSGIQHQKVCGRLYPDQLDRTMQAPANKKFYWRWNYIIAFFLFFTKAGAAKAQGGIIKKEVSLPQTLPPALVAVRPDSPKHMEIIMGNMIPPERRVDVKIRVNGRIIDENGEPIPGASITLLPSNTGLVADAEGKFALKLKPRKDSLRVSAIGYEERTISSFGKSEQHITLQKIPLQLEEIVLAGDGTRRTGRLVVGTTTRVDYSFTDSIRNFFSPVPTRINIYPNPVQKDGVLNIELQLKSGHYQLQVLDAAGRILRQKQLDAGAGKRREQLPVESSWSSGNYFIRLVDGRDKVVKDGHFIIR